MLIGIGSNAFFSRHLPLRESGAPVVYLSLERQRYPLVPLRGPELQQESRLRRNFQAIGERERGFLRGRLRLHRHSRARTLLAHYLVRWLSVANKLIA